ncbi:MAG: HAD hydrolase-like protein [Actinomycetaceae bacterium]|nr:HAD hydrolase-like protein [Actinomycetaceae bacterium]
MAELRAVLFDLDGTITDSAPIIRRTMAGLMRDWAGIDRPLEAYSKYVGPPLEDTFAQLGVPAEHIDTFVVEYRRRYDEHLGETTLFDGVVDVLRQVRAQGLGIAIATSKWETVAKAVLDILGVSDLIDTICGSLPDGSRKHKHEVIAHALDQLTELGFIDDADRLETVPLGTRISERDVRHDLIMVGDRDFDTFGAAVHGIRTVLVSWGEGNSAEAKRAWKYVTSSAELTHALLNN